MNKISVALLIFILLFNCCSIPFAVAQNPVKKQISIPFNLTKNGHIVIKASVNGVEGNFIFDTGAGLNVLFNSFAKKVTDLEKTDHFFTGYRATGEALTLDFWKSKSLKIDSLNFTNQRFSIVDIDFPEIDGLISLMPFKNIPLTINYTTKTLSFESRKSMKQLIKKDNSLALQLYDYGENAIDVSTFVKLNDTLKIQVCLDSGAGDESFWFNSRYMKQLNVDSSSVKKAFVKSELNPQVGNTFYLDTISLLSAGNKTSTINNFNAIFVEGLIYEGKTSIKWLGNKITFDIKNKRLLVN